MMRGYLAMVMMGTLVAVPALADPVPVDAKPKMRKVCHAVNNGNPLFPTMVCKQVPVQPAVAPATAPAGATAMPSADPTATPVNGQAPQ